MEGEAFGIPLSLDEVVYIYEPPFRKVWKTQGEIKLIIIGHYRLGFEIDPITNGSSFRVFIYYQLPKSIIGKILEVFFGKIYPKWCVNQMIMGIKDRFVEK